MIDEAVVMAVPQISWRVDEILIIRSGFQQQDMPVRVFASASGQRSTRCTSPYDDDVVILLANHQGDASSPTHP